MTGEIAHSRVVSRIVEILRAEPALADGGVHRFLARAVAREVKYTIVVRKDGSTPQDRATIEGHPVDWITNIAIECYARADGEESPDEASDRLFAQVYERLMADPTLGGLVDNVEDPTLAWDTDDGERRAGCTIAIFPVRHRTTARTLQGA